MYSQDRTAGRSIDWRCHYAMHGTAPDFLPPAERFLAERWSREVRLQVEWESIRARGSHVLRVRLLKPHPFVPSTLIIKGARADPDVDSQSMIYDEWAALELLGDMELAPRFLGGVMDGDAPFLMMEDLGDGTGSPWDVLEGDDAGAAAAALLDYARTLGRLHAQTSGRADAYRDLRRALPLPPRQRPLFHDPWSNADRYTAAEVASAIAEYRAVLATLGVWGPESLEDEIERVVRAVEECRGDLLVLCQGDQNSLQHCFRTSGGFRMIDFGSAGFRHALLEGMPHRMTWGCTERVPRRFFADFERVYRAELAKGCPAARDEAVFNRAMLNAGGRWTVFHVIWRVPDALQGDRRRGATSLRQQTLAWLQAFADLSDESDDLPALGHCARLVRERLKDAWPEYTHAVPLYRAFR